MNNAITGNIDPRAKRWGVVAKYGALLVVGFFVAPFVFQAITCLVGLVVAAAILLVTWMLAPTVEAMARNMRLRLLKEEAARNPIETLENELLRRSGELQERKTKVLQLAAKTENFGAQLEDFKRRFPDRARRYQEIYDKMKELVMRSNQQLKQATSQLVAFEGQIEGARAEWAMAQSATDLHKSAGKVEEEFLAKVRTSAAFESVQLGMSTAFATLDQLLIESDTVEINVTGTAPQEAKAALPAPDSRPSLESYDSIKTKELR